MPPAAMPPLTSRMVPLFDFDRAEAFYREVFYITIAGSAVDFCPGNGTSALMCCIDDIPCTLIA
eukprot:5203862-Amphidinium_carterae.1